MNEPAQPVNPEQISSLAADEVLRYLHLTPEHRVYPLLFRLLQPPAMRFARIAVRLDERIGQVGIRQAASETLSNFFHSWVFEGAERIPAEGPLLITANHPGGADMIALIATINRPDLRIVSSDRKIFRALPNLSRYMIYLPKPEYVSDRMAAIRTVIHELRQGLAVFIFPHGKWEPDPEILPSAVPQYLRNWSQSIGIFLNKVPETILQPAVVRGILNRSAWHNPFAGLVKTPLMRQNIAVVLQTVWQRVRPSMFPVNVRVRFGEPVPAPALDPSLDPHALHQAALHQTARLLELPSL